MNLYADLKPIICTLSIQGNSSYACDLLLDPPPYLNNWQMGTFKRIPNNKVLNITQNQGIWWVVDPPYSELCFALGSNPVARIYLSDVPVNFFVMTSNYGTEYRGQGEMHIPKYSLDYWIHKS